ncbi:serine hydrolase [Phycisphaeraceae bacterium D3-23]
MRLTLNRRTNRAATLLILAGLAGAGNAAGEDWFAPVFADTHGRFGGVMDDPEAHRVQVLVSEVVEGEDGQATLRRHGYRADAEYFYPASSIKIAACVAALLEVQRWQEELGLDADVDTPLAFHGADGSVLEHDASNVVDGTVTVRHEIRKVCLVSDNPGFNRLFDLVGRDALNQTMWDAGLPSFRLRHQLIGGGPGERRGDPETTPRVELRTSGGGHTLPPRTAEIELPTQRPDDAYRFGEAYIAAGQRHDGPFDFTQRNEVALADLHDLLIMIARPDIGLGKPGLPLTDAHRALLVEAMSQDPLTSANPVYPSPPHEPGFAQSWPLAGVQRVVDGGAVTETQKGGLAYGFVIENAYYVDETTGRSFFLTATIYHNPNATFNDDTYGYDFSRQFLTDLGEAVARRLWGPAPDQHE